MEFIPDVGGGKLVEVNPPGLPFRLQLPMKTVDIAICCRILSNMKKEYHYKQFFEMHMGTNFSYFDPYLILI